MLNNVPVSSDSIVRLKTMVSPFILKGMIYMLLFVSIILILHPSTSQSSTLFKYHQVAMGTVFEIALIGGDEEQANKAALQAFQEVKRNEQLMSPKIESGDVFRINQFAGKEWVKVSNETLEVIKKAQEISKLSNGGFDITIGPLTDLWRKAREKNTPPSLENVRKKLDLVDYKNLEIDQEGKVFLKKSITLAL